MRVDIRQSRRIWAILGIMIVGVVVVTMRLFLFAVVQRDDLRQDGILLREYAKPVPPQRGFIFDRSGSVLAAPGNDYRIGVSPPLLYDARGLATDLAPILLRPRSELLAAIQVNKPYVLLEGRVSAEIAGEIEALDYYGVEIEPLPRRLYPQGELMCHALGYVDFENNGGGGLEAYYQTELAGLAGSNRSSANPNVPRFLQAAERGVDLALTVDVTIQRTVERHLRQALETYKAEAGTIVVMEPQTGAILAMASLPCFDPSRFFDTSYELFLNPAISRQYEPGSVMKLVTMATALDSGTVTPGTTYVDTGEYVLGESTITNSDFSAPGVTDMTTIIVRSLNVGTATIASWMDPDEFYSYMERFGFGQVTGVDLLAESPGTMLRPGHPLWTPIDIATNSFGQGLAVTPLQMLSAVAAIANGGEQMRPYIVQERRLPNGDVFVTEPEVMSRPISRQAADQVTAMAIQAVGQAEVYGYTSAGKTGTAQIPEGGVYHPTDTIASYVGWLPAEAPQIAILIKLDRPETSPWGSQTAAPAFARLANELVLLLDIPPDSIRIGSTAVTNGN